MINVNSTEVLFLRDRQESDKKAELLKAAKIAVSLNLGDILGNTKADLWETVYFAQLEIAQNHI